VTRSSRHGFSVRPRTLLIAIAVTLALGAAAVWYWPQPGTGTGRVELLDFSPDATGTASFAGAFPAEGDTPLANPLGMAWDGEALYVAESDAGVIRLFDAEGGRLGSITLGVAEGRVAVYPSSIAATDDGRLAVVDNAAERVVVIAAEPSERAEVLLTLVGADGAPLQPTAVTYAVGEFYVFDALTRSVHVYDSDGVLTRTIGAGMMPALSIVAGMCRVDETLYVADSGAGRVIGLNVETGEQVLVYPDRYTLPRTVLPVGAVRIAVLDTFERAVYLTGTDGVREAAIDAVTVPAGQMASPRGAAWLADTGRLYVSDAEVGRILVYNVRTGEGQ